MEWGEYRLGDLFEKVKVNTLKYKTKDLPSKPNEESPLPALTAGIQNQGLNNYVPKEGATILQNVISISANGANTGATFYQPHEFTVLQDAYAIEWKFTEEILSSNAYLFITSSISRVIYGKYEWTNKAGWERIKDELIQLPTRGGEIDYEFMERFIAELNAARLAELNAYLTITGLRDYELSEAERTCLARFERGETQWAEFQLGELFTFYAIKQARSQKEIPTDNSCFGVPYVVQSMFNNMFSRNVNRQWLIENGEAPVSGNRIALGVTLPAVSYQPREFGASQVITACADWLNEKVGNFVTTSISKQMYQFNYGCKPGLEIYKKLQIYLPKLKGGSKPDYAEMELLISAVQKLVIRDVVDYADRRIASTAEVIAGRE